MCVTDSSENTSVRDRDLQHPACGPALINLIRRTVGEGGGTNKTSDCNVSEPNTTLNPFITHGQHYNAIPVYSGNRMYFISPSTDRMCHTTHYYMTTFNWG